MTSGETDRTPERRSLQGQGGGWCHVAWVFYVCFSLPDFHLAIGGVFLCCRSVFLLQLLIHFLVVYQDAQSRQWVCKAFLGDAASVERVRRDCSVVLDGPSRLCSAASGLLVHALTSNLGVGSHNIYSTVFLLSAVHGVWRMSAPGSASGIRGHDFILIWLLALDVVDVVVCRRKGNDAAVRRDCGPEDKEVYSFVVSAAAAW